MVRIYYNYNKKQIEFHILVSKRANVVIYFITERK
jgi:hypothetical protein